jgi:hypothetical protein
MRKILIPIDAGNRARTMAAVAEAVRIYSQEPVAIHPSTSCSTAPARKTWPRPRPC